MKFGIMVSDRAKIGGEKLVVGLEAGVFTAGF